MGNPPILTILALAGYFDADVTLRQFSSIFLGDLYRACSESYADVLCEGFTPKSTFANALTRGG